jgi:hypothetical protein
MAAMHDPSDDEQAHDVLAAEAFALGAADPDLHTRNAAAHDVLAAEEFEIPAPDPALHERAGDAHDVLAADEFAVGAADPTLTHHPFVAPVNPADPDGSSEPHDVLAAEEFALPAPPPESRVPISAAPSPVRPILVAGIALLALVLIRRRRRG